MLIWGVNMAVAKTGLSELPPILLMAMRFSLVAALVVPFVRRPQAPLLRVIALSFTLGFLHFALFFSGLKGLDAAVAVIVVQLQVPFAVLLAAIFLDDRPGWRRVCPAARSAGADGRTPRRPPPDRRPSRRPPPRFRQRKTRGGPGIRRRARASRASAFPRCTRE